ncbi:helix-turn-helix transcriptional regulator [Oxalobacter sp. JAC-2022]|uniref:helix-turn-helix transcriptional regulator n=1 Tax=Oxalobacter aliiformigenes TaxID=2946593 RepID=UPI0022AEC6A2|nr:helix-turn-helix transcriptional regulator [Oxalobacter aliiformigenes]MCZ4065133.1 helix-turn-helix transcriptional regulator [Oxalobacter aliiformigenes]
MKRVAISHVRAIRTEQGFCIRSDGVRGEGMDGNGRLQSAIVTLQERFASLNWSFHDFPAGQRHEKICRWPGVEDEKILLCVHRSDGVQEPFHYHDFFYFNYTYRGEYDSLSDRYDRRIPIRERELYAGQPFAGHALCVHDNAETIIIGVLIRREMFLRAFLPMLPAGSRLFRFFLDPATDSFSEEFIHFRIEDDSDIHSLLEMMVVEYAFRKEDTQDILKPLALAFLAQVARHYARFGAHLVHKKLSDRIMHYMGGHTDTVTLRDIAVRFSCHPNYVSTLLRRDTGMTFSEILRKLRMERAVILLRESGLPVEEIAMMLGYGSSHFYRVFREYYRMSPRRYLASGGKPQGK